VLHRCLVSDHHHSPRTLAERLERNFIGAALAGYLAALDAHAVGSAAERRAWTSVQAGREELVGAVDELRYEPWMAPCAEDGLLDDLLDASQAEARAWGELVEAAEAFDRLPRRLRQRRSRRYEELLDELRWKVFCYAGKLMTFRGLATRLLRYAEAS